MSKAIDKKRSSQCKPEWKIILEHLVYQDENLLYRICRKMMIHLDRMKTPEIYRLFKDIKPRSAFQDLRSVNTNIPRTMQTPFNPSEIVDELFEIADKYLSDESIMALISRWIHQEHISFLPNLLERRLAPLSEVIEAFKRFKRMIPAHNVISDNERIGICVSLIQRLLSENLKYINIAKKYINLEVFDELLDRIAGFASGNGKLGGKSAGLLLANRILDERKKNNPLLSNVSVPKSWFLTSDWVLEFVHYNALEEFIFKKYQPKDEIRQEFQFLEYIFANSHFPPEAMASLSMILDDMADKPLIVRSSSLLEDSFEASFSGKYKSLFISNRGTKTERLKSLCTAIAEIYASTFSPDPIEYRRERGLLDFREEMGILIQEVVGKQIGKYYLPIYAGVAFSNNEFRWAPRIRREDGIVRLVLGLGTRAVDRTHSDYPRLVSPGQPSIRVNNTTHRVVNYSQHLIDVINFESDKFDTISLQELIDEAGGYFPQLENIISFNRSDTIVEPISSYIDFRKEDPVITFNNMIQKTDFIKQIKEILNELQNAFESPVDIEFAYDGSTLYMLQCRPQILAKGVGKINIPTNFERDNSLFETKYYVSSGLVKDIKYIIYVDAEGYSSLPSAEDMFNIGRAISALNAKLSKKEFILIGPGRWGSKGDVKLGVPVLYSDINNTAMLIEVGREKAGYSPELSFGTHFFQDLVEADIKYLPLYPDLSGCSIREEFFSKYPNRLSIVAPEFRKYAKVIKVILMDDVFPNSSLSVYMDGDSSFAVALIE
jgi:hypothetical protein